jgi:hypothetical protein
MTVGNASNWEIQHDKMRSLVLEQDMARDSSVKSGNVAAPIAWQRRPGGNRTGEPQVAWPRDRRQLSRLGSSRSEPAAATATLRLTRNYS